MHEIDMASPSWGQDPDEDAQVLDFPGQGFGSLDFRDLDATPEEVGAVLDAVDEADAEMAAEALAALPDAELQRLADEGGSYPADLAPGTPFSDWMDSLGSREFSAIREEASLTGGDEFDYLRSVRDLDTALANQAQREHDRQAEDRAGRDRRTGARHRRPTDEVLLATGMQRIEANTYLRGQVDLASWPGPDADGLLGISQGTALDAEAELRYQILGDRPPPARSRPQPGLPAVSDLARKIGLVS